MRTDLETLVYRLGRLRRRALRRLTGWQQLNSKNPLGDLEWNELPEGQGEAFDEVLVSLLAFAPDGSATALGSGFIVQTHERRAIGITAAHVLWDAAHKAQHPAPAHHPSTPDFFRANLEAVYVGPKRLRAAFAHNGRAALPPVTWVVWDKAAELAFFVLEHGDDLAEPAPFGPNLQISEELPRVGTRVGILGYAGMEIEQEQGRGFRSFNIRRRQVLRVGRVSEVHPEGHVLCRAPCVVTSIPVFPGMSGGAAFVIPAPGEPLKAFGVVSHDSDASFEVKQNRWKEGASVIAKFPVQDIQRQDGQSTVSMLVRNVGVGRT